MPMRLSAITSKVARDLRTNPDQWLRLPDSSLLLYAQPPEIQTQGNSNLELRFTMPSKTR